MCFSATASFSTGAVLTVAGAFSIKQAKQKETLPFASIPFIFAAQQVIEGMLWLALSNPEYAFLENFSTYSFLFVAQVIWPFWVPFSIHKFSDFKKRPITKRIGQSLIVVGAFVSIALGYHLFYYPVEGSILGNHIHYEQDYPEKYRLLGGILYVLVTILPPFLSKNKRMWLLGILIFSSYIITEIFYTQYIVSVWCFFAAILSAVVLWVVQKN